MLKNKETLPVGTPVSIINMYNIIQSVKTNIALTVSLQLEKDNIYHEKPSKEVSKK